MQEEDIDVILTALEDQLKADPRVYDVAVESEDRDSLFGFH